MPKGYKNPNDYVFLMLDEAPYLWESSGKLYFFDIDQTCYMWLPEKKWWAETSSFLYVDYAYEGVSPGDTVTPEEAKDRYPGSIPLTIFSNKTKQGKRSKIYKQLIAASTDRQVYEAPANLPRGFGFTDAENVRIYAHKLKVQEHAVGKVLFSVGPSYVGLFWESGVEPANRLPETKRFENKNEAQAWVVTELRRLEKEGRND